MDSIKPELPVKFHSHDRGFARLYYKSKLGVLYCRSDDLANDDVSWSVCSTDGEPSHKVSGIEIDTTTEKNNVFAYLEILRESGAVNMMGAAPYLERDLGMDSDQAEYWTMQWIKQ